MVDVFQRHPINQTPPLVGHNTVHSDAALQSGVRAFVTQPNLNLLAAINKVGELAGSALAREHGVLANQNVPILHSHDRFGERIDRVSFHPSWHWLMKHAVKFGFAGHPWFSSEPDAHLQRAAGYLAWSAVEPGHSCPITMTYSVVPALAADPELAGRFWPGLGARTYDPRELPAKSKKGLLAGMGMTEKQGGSDVRANVTEAIAQDDGSYMLRGHKWFTSAPMNDLFLMLGQAPGGLSCFVVPRVVDDASQLHLVRLKDKLGNRSNASAEIELQHSQAWLLGEEGAGVKAIIEMVAATRLDCVLGSASLMRRAVAEATWHADHRVVFGSPLARQPAMTQVLADLALESEAATMLALRLAATLDHDQDEHEQALRRIGLPIAKFWVCKRTPTLVAEAMEVLGGNGYVEESVLPLLFRESPLNSIWEGSGNVMALDLLRVLRRHPESLEAWQTEVLASGHPGLAAATVKIMDQWGTPLDADEWGQNEARSLAARLTVLLQASLLVRHSPHHLGDAFVRSRVIQPERGVFGCLPGAVDAAAISRRATPFIDGPHTN
jgi:putative acyl-CoA dehydrogenase